MNDRNNDINYQHFIFLQFRRNNTPNAHDVCI